MARIPMNKNEIREVEKLQRSGMPWDVAERMRGGFELSEREREVVRNFGKVYVESYKKEGKWVKPQLRDLPSSTHSSTVGNREPFIKPIYDKHNFEGRMWMIFKYESNEIPYDEKFYPKIISDKGKMFKWMSWDSDKKLVRYKEILPSEYANMRG